MTNYNILRTRLIRSMALTDVLKIHFNIIILTMPRSKWSLSLTFLHQNHVRTSPLPQNSYMLQFREIVCDYAKWIHLVQDVTKCRAFENVTSICSHTSSRILLDNRYDLKLLEKDVVLRLCL